MSKPPGWPGAIVLAAALLAAGCGPAGERRPNIVLITVDTLRRDFVSAYGGAKARTAAIDRLVREGALFERAYCDVNWTTPSLTSTMTGLYALRHGVRSHYDRAAPGLVTVAEVLRDGGYQTGAVIAAYPLDSIFGLDQGFDQYDDTFTKSIVTPRKRPAPEKPAAAAGRSAQLHQNAPVKSLRPDDQVTAAALRMLRGFTKGKVPFFLWVHYFGPHSKPDMRFLDVVNHMRHIDSYPGEIGKTDAEIGRLLGALEGAGILDDTLIIVHADHGESLGDHPFIGHGVELYEDTLRIPLVLRWPGKVPPGARYGALVGNIDIAPTIFEAAGAKIDTSGLDGRSLFRVIRDGEEIHTALYSETYMGAHAGFAGTLLLDSGKRVKVGRRRMAVVRLPWKYMVTEAYPLYESEIRYVPEEFRRKADREELYNVIDDPEEQVDRIESEPEVRRALRAALGRYRSEGTKPPAENRLPVTEEHLQKLKSLGYVE